MSMPALLESWSPWHYLGAFVLLAAAVLFTAKWIARSDAELLAAGTPRSAILEWTISPHEAGGIVDRWVKANVLWPATRGTLIDTFFFIPLYSTLFALLGFWCAAGLDPQSPWRMAYLAGAWCGWAAGALDLIENAGILAEVRNRWFFVAAPTAIAACLKWSVLLVCTALILSRPLRALLSRMS